MYNVYFIQAYVYASDTQNYLCRFDLNIKYISTRIHYGREEKKNNLYKHIISLLVAAICDHSKQNFNK